MDLTTKRIVTVVVAIIALFILGFGIMTVFGAPSLESMTNAWGPVDEDEVTVNTTLEVDNPNPVGLGMGVDSVDYVLVMNDVPLAEGAVGEVDLPTGTSTTNLTTAVAVDRIPEWWATHVDRGEQSDLDIEATIHAGVGPISRSPTITHSDTVETDLEQTMADAVEEFEGNYTGPTIGIDPITIEPQINIVDSDATWGEVDEAETQILLHFTIHNPNDYPIPVPTFAGSMEFNEVVIGDWDANDVDLVEGPEDAFIPSESQREVILGVTIDNQRFAEWFPTHVDNEERTTARINAQLAIQLSGFTILLPPGDDAISCTYDIQTAILIDQESGVLDRDCSVAGFAVSDDAVEDSWATLNLRDTDWWDEFVGLLAHNRP